VKLTCYHFVVFSHLDCLGTEGEVFINYKQPIKLPFNIIMHSVCCNLLLLFTKQYKLVPASAGGKVHHRSGVGHAGSHYRRTLRLAATDMAINQ